MRINSRSLRTSLEIEEASPGRRKLAQRAISPPAIRSPASLESVRSGLARSCFMCSALEVPGSGRIPTACAQWQDGLAALQGLSLALLIDTKHNGLVGRIEIEPYNMRTFSTNIGSLLTLKESTRWGLSPKARQIRKTECSEMPASFAIRRLLQCVRARGVVSSVLVRTSSTFLSSMLRGAPLRGASASASIFSRA